MQWKNARDRLGTFKEVVHRKKSEDFISISMALNAKLLLCK